MKIELIEAMAGQKTSLFLLMSIIETFRIKPIKKWHIIGIE
jgi:hypothetical protein